MATTQTKFVINKETLKATLKPVDTPLETNEEEFASISDLIAPPIGLPVQEPVRLQPQSELRELLDLYKATNIVLDYVNNNAKANEGTYENVMPKEMKEEMYREMKRFTKIRNHLLLKLKELVENHEIVIEFEGEG